MRMMLALVAGLKAADAHDARSRGVASLARRLLMAADAHDGVAGLKAAQCAPPHPHQHGPHPRAGRTLRMLRLRHEVLMVC